MRVRRLQILLLLTVALAHGLADGAVAGWELTFSDEFDEASLNADKWKTSDLWANQTLAGNGELQCYVPSAIRQADGILSIVADRKVTEAASCFGAKQDLQFTSGMITTAGCNLYERAAHCERLKSFSQAYGYFEMRAALPKGRGLWPAFWLVPIDGTWPPEIDVVEAVGDPSTVHHTYHYLDLSGVKQKTAKAVQIDRRYDDDGFHTFAVDWQPDRLVWYVDGIETYRVQGSHVTNKPMYILINMAVGGYWPGAPSASTSFPATMKIDYVRVYKRVPDGSADPAPPRLE